MGEYLEAGGSDRLSASLEIAPAVAVHALDLHGATVGQGTEEHPLIFITFYDSERRPHNFALHTEASQSLTNALNEALPVLTKLEEDLKARRN